MKKWWKFSKILFISLAVFSFLVLGATKVEGGYCTSTAQQFDCGVWKNAECDPPGCDPLINEDCTCSQQCVADPKFSGGCVLSGGSCTDNCGILRSDGCNLSGFSCTYVSAPTPTLAPGEPTLPPPTPFTNLYHQVFRIGFFEDKNRNGVWDVGERMVVPADISGIYPVDDPNRDIHSVIPDYIYLERSGKIYDISYSVKKTNNIGSSGDVSSDFSFVGSKTGCEVYKGDDGRYYDTAIGKFADKCREDHDNFYGTVSPDLSWALVTGWGTCPDYPSYNVWNSVTGLIGSLTLDQNQAPYKITITLTAPYSWAFTNGSGTISREKIVEFNASASDNVTFFKAVGMAPNNYPPQVLGFSIDSPNEDDNLTAETVCKGDEGNIVEFTTNFFDDDEPFENLVGNGSFEDGSNRWYTEAGIEANIDGSISEFKSHSIKIRKDSDGGHLPSLWIDYGENLAGKSFTLSFSVRADQEGLLGPAWLQTYPTDGDWSNSRVAIPDAGNPSILEVDTSWKRYVLHLTFPDGFSESQFRVVLWPLDDSSSWVWYDGVLVQEGTTKGIFSDIRVFQLNIENQWSSGAYDGSSWPLRMMFNQNWNYYQSKGKDYFYFTDNTEKDGSGNYIWSWGEAVFDASNNCYYLKDDVDLNRATILGVDNDGIPQTFFTVGNGLVYAYWKVRLKDSFPEDSFHTNLYVKDWVYQEDEGEEFSDNILEIDGNNNDPFDNKYDFHRMGTLTVQNCTGTITGYVYQDDGFECKDSVPANEGWKVRCNDIEAHIEGNSFTCVDSDGNEDLPYGEEYRIDFTPSPDNISVCTYDSDCCSNSVTVILDSDNPNDNSTKFFQALNPDPWFQTQGGDVYGQNGITSSIPAACAGNPSCLAYFSLVLNGFAGLVSSPDGTSRNFGSGSAVEGEADWSVDGSLSRVKNAYSYSYFANLLDVSCEAGKGDNNSYNDDVSCLFDVSSIGDKPDFSSYPVYVYQASTNNLTITGDNWNVGDEKGIVLISFADSLNGTVTINPQISVGDNGFFALITNGSIKFTQEAGPDSSDPLVEGVYIADQRIETNESDDDNQKFIGKGIFFAKEGFALRRDLEGGNATSPAELFIFDPQYLFTAPRIFRESLQQWQEVAP